MTDLTGKRIRINENYSNGACKGIEGTVILWREDGWCVVEMHLGDKTSKFILIEEWFVIIEEDSMEKSPQDSLTELQKLCTTNKIHILISENDYQIWDEHSDDTYEMDSVDDVMKAIECLNELKKWRQ